MGSTPGTKAERPPSVRPFFSLALARAPMRTSATSMLREELPDGVRLRDGEATLTLTRPARNVELLRAQGFASAMFADAILAQREEIIRECGTIYLFDDLELVRGYHSDVRANLTKWSRKHRAEIMGFHILTGSKIVMMGVALANLALGGHIQAHTARPSFELALQQAIKSAGR
jgi:hypothetical protein